MNVIIIIATNSTIKALKIYIHTTHIKYAPGFEGH